MNFKKWNNVQRVVVSIGSVLITNALTFFSSVDETHEMSMKENEQSRCVYVQKFTFEGEIKKV